MRKTGESLRLVGAMLLALSVLFGTGFTVAAQQATPVIPTGSTSLTIEKVMCAEIVSGNNSAACNGRDGSLDGQSISFSVTSSAGEVSPSVVLNGSEGSTTITVAAGDLTVCENAPGGTVRKFMRSSVPFAGSSPGCGTFSGEAISRHGGAITLTFFNQLGGGGQTPPSTLPPTQETGTITIHKVDDNGDPLPGACFQVWVDQGNGTITGGPVNGGCDQGDGSNDGTLTFTVQAGNYVLVESSAPAGYALAARMRVTVTAGTDTPATIANQKGGAVLAVHKLDENGELLGGACWYILSSQHSFVTSNCDGPKGGPFDGITWFSGLVPGDYTLVEQAVPQGYQRHTDVPFTITGDEVGGPAVLIEVTDDPISGGTVTPAPTQTPGGGGVVTPVPTEPVTQAASTRAAAASSATKTATKAGKGTTATTLPVTGAGEHGSESGAFVLLMGTMSMLLLAAGVKLRRRT